LGIDPIAEPPPVKPATATGGRSAAQVLEWSRGLVEPALRQAVERLSQPVRHIAGYHFGWWDAAGTEAEASGGKGIRPALALLCAQAVGAPAGVAVPAAVAVELVHNFSLLHDDVMDRDESRRHRLTAWRVFGVGEAILAGDAMVTLAVEVLNRAAPHPEGLPQGGATAAAELVRTLCDSVQTLVEGQMADLSFERRSGVGLSECLQMARNKTGALLAAACRLGAQAGGGSDDQVDALTAFGAQLGLAFQVNDDLLGIWGDPDTTGKADYSDLRNRKKSLPVAAALAAGTVASRRLEEWFASTTEPTAGDVELVAALIEEAGGRDWARAQLASLGSVAVGHLHRARPAAASAAELTVLVAMVTAAA